jgi:hypothetical protein
MATSEQSRYAIRFSGAEFVIANLTLESTMNNVTSAGSLSDDDEDDNDDGGNDDGLVC